MSPRTLTLASFNLYSGRHTSDHSVDATDILSAIESLDADILGLQEVDRFQPRSGGLDEFDLASAAMQAKEVRFTETVWGVPGDRMARHGRPADQVGDPATGGPSYGIALLTRRPAARWFELRMQPMRWRQPSLVVADDGMRRFRIVRDDEQRVALAVELEDPSMTVAVTHLSFVPQVNAWQLLRVRRWLEGLPGPCVLLGDLNMSSRMASSLTSWRTMAEFDTFPADAPCRQLDHILSRGLPDSLTSRSAALRLPISDHRALRTELQW